MLEFVLQKMINKKWMIICLIIGNILLVGVAACNPMYTDAIQKKSLTMAMNNYLIEKNRYPFEVKVNSTINNKDSAKSYESFFEAEDKVQQMKTDMGIDLVQSVTTYYIPKQNCETKSKYNGSPAKKELSVAMLEGMDEHLKIVSGEMYSDSPESDGTIQALISQKTLVSQKLLIGEILIFDDIEIDDGKPLKIRIVGVFENSRDDDLYWVNSPNSISSQLFIPEKIFMEKFGDFEKTEYKTVGVWTLLFDYEQINEGNRKSIIDKTQSYMNFFSQKMAYTMQTSYYDILLEQQMDSRKVESTLRVLQVPVLVLLAAFIFMVSGQILEIEQNDISILKSRGASKKQILSTYFIQSGIVSVIGIIAGLPVAALLCQIFGSSNAFLEFVQRRALSLRLSWEVIAYMFIAVLISIAAMVVPVFKFADLTIVETKQKRNRKKVKVWWQRFYIDFVMFAVSLYGFYTFNSNKSELAKKAINGSLVDPLLFLSSSLFILGTGLIFLRIIPLIVRMIFKINKNKWAPSSYASFLQVIRSKNKQYFIMVFIILTVSFGIFNAKAARTINSNEENKICYSNGADVVLMEQWETVDDEAGLDEGLSGSADNYDSGSESKENMQNEDKEAKDEDSGDLSEGENVTASEYIEPDIEKYKTIEGVESIAKVYLTEEAKISVQVSNDNVSDQKITLMGISTKDFGETAWFEDEELLPTHWYNYLNAISQNTSGVLVSSNFRDKLGYKLGDVITYKTASKQNARGVIYGFVDYWPGYINKITETNSDGSENSFDNFLIVSHLSKLQSLDGVLPYQVWIKINGSTQKVYDFIADKKIKLEFLKDTKEDVIEMKNNPVIQGTNGILTVGFIVVLILCCVGFLIYWILSINSRALQFGIFRAMGMTIKEIVFMLIYEQLLITLPTILIGTIIGFVSSKLYIPLIQIAYSDAQNVIPLRVISASLDIVKMYIYVIVVMGICMIVLGEIIKKIKIGQTLKLGED